MQRVFIPRATDTKKRRGGRLVMELVAARTESRLCAHQLWTRAFVVPAGVPNQVAESAREQIDAKQHVQHQGMECARSEACLLDDATDPAESDSDAM